MTNIKIILVFLTALWAVPCSAQNTFFPANSGDMIVKGGAGAWVAVPGGTAGCALISNGPTAAPTWQCALPLNFQLPPMAINTLWCNVSGAQASATACNISQILNTIDYDIQRPPLAGSIPYVGTDNKWHLASPPTPPGWVWTAQGTGVIPQWAPPGGYIQPGAIGTCLVSNGPLVAPSFGTCPTGAVVVNSVFGRLGAVVALSGDYSVGQVTGAAPLASPALTGVPTAPTAAPGTNTTQVATTAFAIANGAPVTSVFGRLGTVVATLGDYTSAIINHTTGGTSPATNPALNTIRKILYAKENYGATCDGVTDDTAKFQHMIDEAIATASSARFSGSCKITSLSITAGMDFGGITPSNSILVGTSGSTAIAINSLTGVRLSNFQISYASTTSGDAAISVTSPSAENQLSRFINLETHGSYNGIVFTKADLFIIKDSFIDVAGGTGILVQNTNNVDAGDSTIEATVIAGTPVIGLDWRSSGGLRWENSKINGAATLTVGIRVALASGANTSDLFFLGGSIEGFTPSGVGIQFSRLGATGNLYHVQIANLEIGGPQIGVQVTTDANGTWLNNLNISNVSIQTNSASITIAYQFAVTVNGVSVQGGSVLAQGVTNVVFQITGTQTANNCVIGMVAKNGTFAASTVGACTTYVPF